MKACVLFISLLMIGCSAAWSQGVPEYSVVSKLPQGKYLQHEYYLDHGDTVLQKFQRYAFTCDHNDTILLIEEYNVHRSWLLSRLVVHGREREQAGWQWEFDTRGNPLNERYCDTATGKCERYFQYNYYPNGHLMARIQYDRRRLDGSSYFYFNDGSLKNHLEYHNNRLVNVHAYYDQQGHILDPGDFCDGNGVLNVYAANGVMVKKKYYMGGKEKGKRRKEKGVSG